MVHKFGAVAVLVFAFAATGCAAQSADSDTELVRSTHEALSASPKNLLPIFARATFDPTLGRTMLDVSTSQIPAIGNVPVSDPHTADQFLALLVYVDRAGRRDLVEVVAGPEIGPGGGCVHVALNANVGDRIFVGGAVRLAGETRVHVASVTSPVTIVSGDWANDPTVQIHVSDAPH